MNMHNLNFFLLFEKTEVDVRFDYLNTTQKISSSSYSSHHHTVYEVYFIENGNMSVCFDNNEIMLNTHDILLIAPGTVHRVNTCSESLERFNFRFLIKTQTTDVMTSPYILLRLSPEIETEIFQNIQKINFHISQFEKQWESHRIKNYFSIIVSYIIETLMPQTTEKREILSYSNSNRSKIDIYVQLDNFFINNYTHQVTIGDLAKELNYSNNHINRLLKHYWGVSFSEKLNDIRLKAAKEYLTNSLLPVHQIAEKCGYLSLRGFEIFFLKHTGMLPKDYRKMYKT